MDCIKYIDDLGIELNILSDLKENRIINNQDYSDLDEQIKEKKDLIEKCKNNLEKLSCNQIYYKLYLNILNGMTPSKAVEKVADDNYKNGVKPTDISTIWTNYYKKMKKIIKTK